MADGFVYVRVKIDGNYVHQGVNMGPGESMTFDLGDGSEGITVEIVGVSVDGHVAGKLGDTVQWQNAVEGDDTILQLPDPVLNEGQE